MHRTRCPSAYAQPVSVDCVGIAGVRHGMATLSVRSGYIHPRCPAANRRRTARHRHPQKWGCRPKSGKWRFQEMTGSGMAGEHAAARRRCCAIAPDSNGLPPVRCCRASRKRGFSACTNGSRCGINGGAQSDAGPRARARTALFHRFVALPVPLAKHRGCPG